MTITSSKDGQQVEVKLPIMPALLPFCLAGATAGLCIYTKQTTRTTVLSSVIAFGIGSVPFVLAYGSAKSQAFENLKLEAEKKRKELEGKKESIDPLTHSHDNAGANGQPSPAEPTAHAGQPQMQPSGGNDQAYVAATQESPAQKAQTADILMIISEGLPDDPQVDLGWDMKKGYFRDKVDALDQATKDGVYDLIFVMNSTIRQEDGTLNAEDKVKFEQLKEFYGEAIYRTAADLVGEVGVAIDSFTQKNADPNFRGAELENLTAAQAPADATDPDAETSPAESTATDSKAGKKAASADETDKAKAKTKPETPKLDTAKKQRRAPLADDTIPRLETKAPKHDPDKLAQVVKNLSRPRGAVAKPTGSSKNHIRKEKRHRK